MSSNTFSVGILAGILLISLWGCKGEEANERDVVAQVYETKLYRDELRRMMPASFSIDDSVRLADQLVMNWVREKALLKTAEDNLSDEQKNVQQQLEEYRNNLIVYAYERAFITQKLDTLITDQELTQYYESNSDNFKLRRYIAQVQFVKIAEDAPKQAQIEKWLASSSEDEIDLLYDYCRKYAENFYFNPDVWLFVDDLMKEVPLPANDIERFLKNDKVFKIEEDGFRYFIHIKDYRFKGELSPISLEKGRIRDLILNKRKVELTSKMREDVVNKGLATGKIKLNTP